MNKVNKRGVFVMISLRQELDSRFVEDKDTGCWNWYGAIDRAGYGMYRNKRAHRLMYELHKGEIPKGLLIRHICHNKLCINPSHLEPGTNIENGYDNKFRPQKKKIYKHWTTRIDNKKPLWQKNIGNKIVVDPNSCWIWQGNYSPHGRPEIHIDHKLISVSSVVYYLYNNEIPHEGMFLQRTCDNPSCVNYEHYTNVPKEKKLNMPMNPDTYAFLVKVQNSLGIKRADALNLIVKCLSELVDMNTLRECNDRMI